MTLAAAWRKAASAFSVTESVVIVSVLSPAFNLVEGFRIIRSQNTLFFKCDQPGWKKGRVVKPKAIDPGAIQTEEVSKPKKVPPTDHFLGNCMPAFQHPAGDAEDRHIRAGQPEKEKIDAIT